eukprot:TRINITY_DN654_c0_g1_i4.p1 TRINITY_DN654_c0_g1~~TRINITY_DN654_c0_g1_i4.p1  ORF type:complete len:151 (-),score=19.29 TRINITY_DN654_c0_g1_i4:34-447(-)
MSSIRQVGSKLIRATVPAQNANMQGLGAQLGQHGFKVIDFCKQFNDQTKTYAKDTPLTTMITLNKDRSFSFIVKPPKTAHLIKMAAQGRGEILDKDCVNIAMIKNDGGVVGDLRQIAKSVAGSASSMNIKVIRTVPE